MWMHIRIDRSSEDLEWNETSLANLLTTASLKTTKGIFLKLFSQPGDEQSPRSVRNNIEGRDLYLKAAHVNNTDKSGFSSICWIFLWGVVEGVQKAGSSQLFKKSRSWSEWSTFNKSSFSSDRHSQHFLQTSDLFLWKFINFVLMRIVQNSKPV